MPTYVPSQCVVLINQALDADTKSASPINVPHIVVWNKTTNCIQYVDTTNGNVIKEVCYGGATNSCVTGNFVSETVQFNATNEDTPVVFSGTFNIVLNTPGLYQIEFGSNVVAIGDPTEACTLQIVSNTNIANPNPDVPTDVVLAEIAHNNMALDGTSDWKFETQVTVVAPVIIKVIYRGAQNAPIIVTDEYGVRYRTLDATLICS